MCSCVFMDVCRRNFTSVCGANGYVNVVCTYVLHERGGSNEFAMSVVNS